MYERWLVGGAANVAQQGVPAAQASNTAANGARQALLSRAVAINELALAAGSQLRTGQGRLQGRAKPSATAGQRPIDG